MINRNKGLAILGGLIVLILSDGCYQLEQKLLPHAGPQISVMIQTPIEEMSASRMAVFSFQHSSGVPDLGKHLASQAQSMLLESKFVQKITYMDTPAYSIPEAIELAKQDDNDLALLGYVNSFLDGGLTSNSVVDLTIKIIDVRTRTTLWSLQGQMKGKPGKSIDFLFFKPEQGKAVSPHLLSRRLLQAMLDTVVQG